MKDSPALIWDLDGTLLDSYAVIVPSLRDACREFGVEREESDILREVITDCVVGFLKKTERESGVSFDALLKRYTEINAGRNMQIGPIRNARRLLELLRGRGIPSYIFTHRGSSTEAVLKNSGLYDYFDEIVCGTDGFPRKPDPAALLYLAEKHSLDKGRTYYVGDRALDMDCAARAGLPCILYLPEGSPAIATGRETHIVADLMEIAELL